MFDVVEHNMHPTAHVQCYYSIWNSLLCLSTDDNNSCGNCLLHAYGVL